MFSLSLFLSRFFFVLISLKSKILETRILRFILNVNLSVKLSITNYPFRFCIHVGTLIRSGSVRDGTIEIDPGSLQ